MHALAPIPGFEPVWNTLPLDVQKRVGSWISERGPATGSPYDFNLALHVDDDPAAVIERRYWLEKSLHIQANWLTQIHGTDCVTISADRSGMPPVSADACVTSIPGQACAIMTADCLPVLLVDDQAKAVGAAHAGWRGLLGGVLQHCCEAVQTQAHTRAQAIHTYLGPAIGPASFEVGQEVRDAFVQRDAEFANHFKPHAYGKWLGDLYGLAMVALRQQGVIYFNGGGVDQAYDTYTDSRWFSYRRSPVTGRMASLIWLRR